MAARDRFVVMFIRDLNNPDFKDLWPIRADEGTAEAICKVTQVGAILGTIPRQDLPTRCDLGPQRSYWDQDSGASFKGVPCLLTAAKQCPPNLPTCG